MNDNIVTVVSYTEPALKSKAQQLAQRLQIPCVSLSELSNADYFLIVTKEHVELRAVQQNFTPLIIDFLLGNNAYRRHQGGGIKQTIAKAIGIKSGYRPTVLDVTAGLGRDAFVFSGLGCDVIMVERSPIISTLLSDGLIRLYANVTQSSDMKLSLVCDDSVNYLKKLSNDNFPDSIYLDPMYPDSKNTAAVKKEMQILRELIGKDQDSNQLLNLALTCAKKRVVVKRPRAADYVSLKKPDLEMISKNHRFDIYFTH